MARRRLFNSIAMDAGALLVALGFASWYTYGRLIPWAGRPHVVPMVLMIAGSGVLGMFLAFRPAASGIQRPSYGRALTETGVMLGLSAVTVVFTRVFWSRSFVLSATAAWLVLNLAHRWVRRRRPWAEPLVLVTSEKALVEDLLDASHAEVVAVLDPSGPGPDHPLQPGTVLAVDLRSVLSDEMARFISSCNLAGYPMRSLVSVYEEHTGRLPIVHLMEGWELTVPLASRGAYVRTKRVADTALVLMTAPISLLLGLLLGAAIAIDSRGGVIFKQRRIGRDGRPFTLYKFRTMRTAVDDEARFATEEADRLTRVGRVLRRFRVDELPQLWNVLKGDLSLVGPRPEQGPFVDRFSETIPFYSHRHLVRPGLTGWAQVNFGYADSEAETIEKLSFDLYYIKHVSPWLDLEILGRSVWTVMSGFGAR